MAGIEAFLKGWVSRVLPQGFTDNDPGIVRLSRYGDVPMIGMVRKQHGLADEGSYFVANNAGTGVATPAAPTAFSDTAPMLTITNTDSAGNTNNKRIHLDFIKLMETAAGTAGTGLRIQIKLDATDRFSSGGTLLSPVSPNMDVPNRASVAIVRFLPTNVAVGGLARTVVGDVVLIPTQGGVIQAFATGHMNFGAVEGGIMGNTPVPASAANWQAAVNFPPIIIGPGQTAIINYLIQAQSAASSWTPEVAWWER